VICDAVFKKVDFCDKDFSNSNTMMWSLCLETVCFSLQARQIGFIQNFLYNNGEKI